MRYFDWPAFFGFLGSLIVWLIIIYFSFYLGIWVGLIVTAFVGYQQYKYIPKAMRDILGIKEDE